MNTRTEVEVVGIVNATEKEKKIFQEAADEFELAINYDGFWDRYVKPFYDDWTWNEGLTYEEFKSLVLNGKDKFESKDDYHIRIKVTFYYKWGKVVGYTYPSTWWTWINRNAFKNFDIPDIAGNQAHEYIHNTGLGHPGRDTRSVTYKFGYAVRDFVRDRRDFWQEPKAVRRTFIDRVKSFFRRWL